MTVRALLKSNKLSGGILICHVDVKINVLAVDAKKIVDLVPLAIKSNLLLLIKLS